MDKGGDMFSLALNFSSVKFYSIKFISIIYEPYKLMVLITACKLNVDTYVIIIC